MSVEDEVCQRMRPKQAKLISVMLFPFSAEEIQTQQEHDCNVDAILTPRWRLGERICNATQHESLCHHET